MTTVHSAGAMVSGGVRTMGRRISRQCARRGALPLALGAVLALGAGCGDPTGIGTRFPLAAGGTASTPAATADALLLGGWVRSVYATDGVGTIYGIETLWTFSADGTARQRVVTTNLVTGLAQEITAVGRWSTAGSTGAGTLTVQFESPSATTLRLSYQVTASDVGPTLLLDGTPYRFLGS